MGAIGFIGDIGFIPDMGFIGLGRRVFKLIVSPDWPAI
jgi:hypothetical protein